MNHFLSIKIWGSTVLVVFSSKTLIWIRASLKIFAWWAPKFRSVFVTQTQQVVCSQWLSNTNLMTEVAQSLTVLNYRRVVDESNVALQVKRRQVLKLIDSLINPRRLSREESSILNSAQWNIIRICSKYSEKILRI